MYKKYRKKKIISNIKISSRDYYQIFHIFEYLSTFSLLRVHRDSFLRRKNPPLDTPHIKAHRHKSAYELAHKLSIRYGALCTGRGTAVPFFLMEERWRWRETRGWLIGRGATQPLASLLLVSFFSLTHVSIPLSLSLSARHSYLSRVPPN